MPPPHNGNQHLSFVDLIKLEQINSTTFRSIALPFAPGGKLERAVGASYGGHVFAQAAWAACQTVAPGLLLYNISGSFILPGFPDSPFIYKVHSIRNGKSSATRIVNVTQKTNADVCFTCTCAFRREEASPLQIEQPVDLWTEYASVLQGQAPGSFESMPGMDVPWYLQYLREGGEDEPFPGLEMTQVPMDTYNENRNPMDQRQLLFYRPIGRLSADPNLHLCAHLYASDRNSLYIIAKFLDVSDLFKSMASLVHTVVFHSPISDLQFGSHPSGNTNKLLDDKGEPGRWFCLENRTDRAGGGRLMLHSRVYGTNGSHVMTIMQDGMTRMSKTANATQDEIGAVQDRVRGWKSREKL